jgi:hypothetical protein
MCAMDDADSQIAIYILLNKAGFICIQANHMPFPQYLLAILPGNPLSNGETLESLGEQFHYFRVTTDQGEFGIWTKPYFVLDLHGTGLNWGDLGHPDIYQLPTEFHEIAGIDENTCLLLWQKLVQRKLKP